MTAGHHKHLLVVEHRLEAQPGLVQRVGRDQQIDLVAEQGTNAAELELLFDVHIHIRPRGQIGRHQFEQPLVAGMAFHADAQRTAFALRELPQALFGQIQLRQHPVGHRQQILASLGQPQAAPLAQPDIGAQLLLQLFHAVAQRRLGQVQHACGGRQRALLLDLLDDGKMDALKHSDDPNSWIVEITPFYFIECEP